MVSGMTTVPVAGARGLARERYVDGRDRGRALGELCRLRNMRVPWLIFVVVGVGAGLGLPALVAGVVVIGAAGAAAAALNDRADVASDRANGRFDRPLVSGLLSDRDVIGVVVGAGLAALAVQPVLPQPTGLAVTVLALVVGAASACEPVALQRRGLVGLLALGLCYLVLPVALAAGWAPALHAIPLAVVGAGVLAHKDARDERGDRLAGKATLVVRVGSRPMARIAFAATMVGAAGLAATLRLGWWILPALVVAVEMGRMARAGHDPERWMRARVALVALALVVAVGVAGA